MRGNQSFRAGETLRAGHASFLIAYVFDELFDELLDDPLHELRHEGGMKASSQRRLARAAALLTLLSLELVWVGVFVCAARCARSACPAPPKSSAGTTAPAEHCGHSGAAPAAPGSPSSSTPDRQHCPASNFHYWSAAASAVGATQVRLAAPVLLAAGTVPASSASLIASDDAIRTSENSPPVIVPVASAIPLRI
jgi:hypothetical protein